MEFKKQTAKMEMRKKGSKFDREAGWIHQKREEGYFFREAGVKMNTCTDSF